MSQNYNTATLSLLFLSLLFTTFTLTLTTSSLLTQPPLLLTYHNGSLLKGNITLNLILYGHFTPSQRAIITDFLLSLYPPPGPAPARPRPTAASWWATTEGYKGGPARVTLGEQLLLQDYPLGRLLTRDHLLGLGLRPNTGPGSVSVVLTAHDVAVEGFCMRCGSHGYVGRGGTRTAYTWVGNSATQCPGQCAWPFHQPIYGPQTPPLVPPNGDVGIDGLVINLATLLAGTVTNPYSDGYFQGPWNAPLEAVTACTGMFGSGSYPGYPGKVLVDEVTGASYNANGVNGRKYLLPAMWDPRSSTCTTLV